MTRTQVKGHGHIYPNVPELIFEEAEPVSAEDLESFTLSPEVGKYFCAREGKRLVLSAWLDAVYPR